MGIEWHECARKMSIPITFFPSEHGGGSLMIDPPVVHTSSAVRILHAVSNISRRARTRGAGSIKHQPKSTKRERKRASIDLQLSTLVFSGHLFPSLGLARRVGYGCFFSRDFGGPTRPHLVQTAVGPNGHSNAGGRGEAPFASSCVGRGSIDVRLADRTWHTPPTPIDWIGVGPHAWIRDGSFQSMRPP